MGTITKALQLLDAFSRQRPEIGLTEFVQIAQRDKATLHRHLSELTENGFLEQNPVTRAYRLGPAILRLSGVREVTHPMRSILSPIVADLSEQTGELAHASLLQGSVLSAVCHTDTKQHRTRVQFDEAEILPLHATSSGLCVLAFSDPGFSRAQLEEPLVAYTNATLTDPDAIKQRLSKIRELGYCLTEKGYDEDVTSLAVPLFGAESKVIGAFAVAFPSLRDSDTKRTQIKTTLMTLAARATERTGGSLPGLYADKWHQDA
ncbi:helix-turn-helix domain-containing protein [Epibacterium sp. SM1979]|uniref:Helix-turn-helix domain-containing protein n=1 Tax=Tritonibacter litoralis TaxID=2662264 RepID=A0A843YDU6_9RHOB|nr:helix-turn-helix domain-containing protein [Tritonibacter litoralis]